MKLHALRGENMMRMKVFDLQLDDKGNLIVVSGKNGEGKSSLINSFVLALGGSKTDVAKLTTKPIREGAKKAFVEVEIGDYIVRRSWSSNDKDSLTVVDKTGKKYASPQKMLNEIVGDLSFDPLAFSRMTAKEQAALLLSIVELPINLEEHDAQRAQLYERRTEIGRDRDRVAGAFEEALVPSADTPDEEVSAADLAERLQAAQEEVRKKADLDLKIAQNQKDINSMEQHVMRLKEENKKLKAERGAFDETEPDIEGLRAQLQQTDLINSNVRAKKQKLKLKTELTQLEEQYDKATRFIDSLDAKKQKALEEAEMPIDGLSLDEDGVTFNDIPFGQLSMSQKIKVSTAIGMAQNPELRLMIVNDGSLLDKDNLKALQQMAEDNDFQIFVEMVDDSGEMGFVVEDGEVVPPEAK